MPNLRNLLISLMSLADIRLSQWQDAAKGNEINIDELHEADENEASKMVAIIQKDLDEGKLILTAICDPTNEVIRVVAIPPDHKGHGCIFGPEFPTADGARGYAIATLQHTQPELWLNINVDHLSVRKFRKEGKALIDLGEIFPVRESEVRAKDQTYEKFTMPNHFVLALANKDSGKEPFYLSDDEVWEHQHFNDILPESMIFYTVEEAKAWLDENDDSYDANDRVWVAEFDATGDFWKAHPIQGQPNSPVDDKETGEELAWEMKR